MTKQSRTRDETFSLMQRLWREHIRRYVFRLCVALVFMILGAASTAALAKLLEPILDEIFIAKNL